MILDIIIAALFVLSPLAIFPVLRNHPEMTDPIVDAPDHTPKLLADLSKDRR